MEENWYPAENEYDPGITKEQWKEFVTDRNIFTEDSLIAFACIQKSTLATCTDMAEEFGRTKNFYNNAIWRTGEKVHKLTNCPLSLSPDKTERFWSICCLGRKMQNGRIELKIRPELKKSFDETGALKGIEVMENEENYSKFKKLLEYFVVHLEYADNEKVDVGYEYIEKFIENGTFKKTGQGYKGDKIQNQIKNFDTYFGTQICINVQFHPSSENYESRRCYLNWKETDVNIVADWENKKISNLCISNWHGKDDFEKQLSIIDLGLFDLKKPNEKLKNFFDDFYKLYRETTEMKNNFLADQLTDLLQHTHNLILHGAPGTGKTFLAKEIAKRMGCTQDEIGFVQFHPSYDYTDFVEGLRPKSQNNGEIGFERKDGVFKEFCKRALLAMNVSSVSDNFEQVWEKVVDYLNEKDFMDIPLLTGKSTFRVELNENGDGLATRTYENGDYKKGEWIQGKSKFYNKEQLYNIYKGLPGIPSRGHDNYRKAVIEYWKKNFGLVDYSVKEKSESESVKPFVFIIDEINRGELSKIFGELFYAVEPGYRVSYDDLKKHQSGEKTISTIRTQYANLETEGNSFDKALRVSNPSDFGHFFIPENVYMIGTMNDIDRSVDTMDFAFRRRFAFREIKASENLGMLDELGEIADKAKARLKKLNEEISKITELSSPLSYHIGGAYFLKLNDFEGDSNERLQKLWDYHLEGLLKEYLRGTENAEENFAKLEKTYFGSENSEITDV
ncbi:AAA family ATPase [uncultured Treponema sp.]|uniref:AAA family ATPase n=1 Tax=uncultured Treponema sp. TaxID=162155 RepID=UPI002596F8D1|nr:AAA family ATPase [uncultured Treponema sp.]